MSGVDKLIPLSEVADLVVDGDVVAIQNMGTQVAPMALARELMRAGRRDLGVVCLIGGVVVDWLACARSMNRFIGAAVTMEQFGVCQQYRRGVEAGRIRVSELSESSLNARLGAAARGLPFLPTRGLLGPDIIAQSPDDLRVIDDPFGTGQQVVACRPLQPDVALVHATRADRFGNVAYDPGVRWPDLGGMPQASQRVIVSVEEIVDTDLLRERPELTVLPGFIVDAVVEVPGGAHPTSLFPRHGYDSPLYQAWTRVSSDDEAAKRFLDELVLAPETFSDYLRAIAARPWEQPDDAR